MVAALGLVSLVPPCRSFGTGLWQLTQFSHSRAYDGMTKRPSASVTSLRPAKTAWAYKDMRQIASAPFDAPSGFTAL